MNNIFVTADPHFGHESIIRHCNRPWKSIEEHDEALIYNWNKTVSKGDLTYLLGDFCMLPKQHNADRMKFYRKLRMRLNSKIILIKGNHDSMSKEVYDCFTEVHEGIREIKVDGVSCTLCHYPMRSWNKSFHGSWHLFGHVHNRLSNVDTGMSFDVGVDVPEYNYCPAPWDLIKQKMYVRYGNFKKNRAYSTSRMGTDRDGSNDESEYVPLT